MTNKEQLENMFSDIQQIIKKHIGDTIDSDIFLEKSSSSERMQIIIKIKNISEMKISFK